MKKLFTLALVILLASCKSGYYQVYKTNSNAPDGIFENADVRIVYDFWAPGGNAGFRFYNKTSEPLTLYLDRSFFIMNGIAHDYYQARIITNSSSTSVSKTVGFRYLYGTYAANQTSQSGVEYTEKPQIVIPANSSKAIAEFTVTPDYFAHCDLKRYPTKKQVRSVSFDQNSSPFIFSNFITYQIGSQTQSVSHDFFVSEITNVPASEAFKNVQTERCEKKTTVREPVHKAADKFYNSYLK